MRIPLPIPIPSRILQATNCPQFCVKADPIGESNEKIHPMNMAPLLAAQLLTGSEIHAALAEHDQNILSFVKSILYSQYCYCDIWRRINKSD